MYDAWPNTLTREQIAETEYDGATYAPDGGGFRNALSKLRTLELIEGTSDIKCVDTLRTEE